MHSPEQYRALTTAAGLVDRSNRGRLRLSGVDRLTYLQGLLTNDVAALTAGTGCYAAYLTAQGRMIADMRVFETGDHTILDTDVSLAPSLAERLAGFVFSEDVEVADITPATSEVGIYGPSAARLVAAMTDVPERELSSLPVHGNRPLDAGLLVRSDDIGILGFDLIVPGEIREETIRRAAEAGAVPVDDDLVEAIRIDAGRPRFLADMDEHTIPLEAGIEDRAISLTKGCYVGQEVIIRVLHRGHGRVARRLVRLTFTDGAAVPSRGDAVMKDGKDVGQVTSAAVSPASGRAVALGYVHRDAAAAGTSVDVRGAAAIVG